MHQLATGVFGKNGALVTVEVWLLFSSGQHTIPVRVRVQQEVLT